MRLGQGGRQALLDEVFGLVRVAHQGMRVAPEAHDVKMERLAQLPVGHAGRVIGDPGIILGR
jgi:hypothetical protein